MCLRTARYRKFQVSLVLILLWVQYFILHTEQLATPAEALNSSLMGFFEKRKFRNFLIFLSNYDKDKPSTYLKGAFPSAQQDYRNL